MHFYLRLPWTRVSMPGLCFDKATLDTCRLEVMVENWVTELTKSILVLLPGLSAQIGV